jgi:hypothetical protein
MLDIAKEPVMLSVIMLSVIMLNVGMLSVIMLSVIMLSVIMLRVIMLSVIMLSVIMLSIIMQSVIMIRVVKSNRQVGPVSYLFLTVQWLRMHCTAQHRTHFSARILFLMKFGTNLSHFA